MQTHTSNIQNKGSSQMRESDSSVQSYGLSGQITVSGDTQAAVSELVSLSESSDSSGLGQRNSDILLHCSTHGCLDESRSNSDNSDSVLSQVSCQRQSHSDHCSLGGTVNNLPPLSLNACNRCNIYYHTSLAPLVKGLLAQHLLCCVLCDIEGSHHIYLQHSHHLLRRQHFSLR